jgi:hypothetical protein
MVNQLKQIAPQRRISSISLDPGCAIRDHNRLFPRSGLMLAFWLSLIYLAIWLACMALSLAMDAG